MSSGLVCLSQNYLQPSISAHSEITQIAKNMDINGRNNLDSHGDQLCEGWNSSSNPLFVNHAEIAWHERRKAWVSDKPPKPIQRLSEPLTSWNITYEDLVTPKCFSPSIPLPDIVDFLCKIWLDKGPSA